MAMHRANIAALRQVHLVQLLSLVAHIALTAKTHREPQIEEFVFSYYAILFRLYLNDLCGRFPTVDFACKIEKPRSGATRI